MTYLFEEASQEEEVSRNLQIGEASYYFTITKACINMRHSEKLITKAS